MKSWITTLGGVMTAAGGAIIGAKATGLVESVPTWLMWIGIILAAIGPVILGAAARDNNKSSEDVGVRHGPHGRRPMLGSCWLLFLLPALILAGCSTAPPPDPGYSGRLSAMDTTYHQVFGDRPLVVGAAQTNEVKP